VIRAATAADAPPVLALDRALFGDDAWSALPLEGRRVVIDERGGVIVGYGVARSSGEVADLERIATHPGHRRHGVATGLLKRLTDAALADGADRMLLEVSADNQVAAAFYAAHGFRRIDVRRRYYRDGSDALVMARNLLEEE
jgi:ribosomal protein S18 acetylase RimI-like enzyme